MDRCNLAVAMNELFERSRQRTDTAFNIVRQKRRQDVEEPIGVLKPLIGCPIRLEHTLLYRSTVKSAKRESVDREHVAIVCFQPALKFAKNAPLNKFARREITQSQT